MAASKRRDKLVNLLDRNVFRPILKKDAGRYSGGDRDTYEEVREKTEQTREKYRKQYGSAEKVYDMYRSDLSSDPAKKVTQKSRQLGLPALEDVEDEMTELAEEVGVRGSST